MLIKLQDSRSEETRQIFDALLLIENGGFPDDITLSQFDQEVSSLLRAHQLTIQGEFSPFFEKKISKPASGRPEEMLKFIAHAYAMIWIQLNGSEELENLIAELLASDEIELAYWQIDLLFLLFLLRRNKGVKPEQLLSVIELRPDEPGPELEELPEIAYNRWVWIHSILTLTSKWLRKEPEVGNESLRFLQVATAQGMPKFLIGVSSIIYMEYAFYHGDFILASDLTLILEHQVSDLGPIWKQWALWYQQMAQLLKGKEPHDPTLNFSKLTFKCNRSALIALRTYALQEIMGFNTARIQEYFKISRQDWAEKFTSRTPLVSAYLEILDGFDLVKRSFIDQAIAKLTDVLYLLQDSQDFISYFLATVLTDLALLYYADTTSYLWLRRAQAFVEMARDVTEGTFSPYLAITSYIHRALIDLAGGDVTSALIWAKRARSVVKQYGQIGYLIWVEHILGYIQTITDTINQGIKVLLRGRDETITYPVLPLPVRIAQHEDFAIIMYTFREQGPYPSWASDGRLVQVKEDEILLYRLGTYFYVMIGQGHNYPAGFFGPLPTTDHPEYESFVLSVMIEDPEQHDPRLEGRNYVLITFVVPRGMLISPLPREHLEQELSRMIIENPKVLDLGEEFARQLRLKIKRLNETLRLFMGDKR